ncbi:hypothetical protein [Alteromonas sp. C1M14]|uniref:hypothetical protein n=1 Tax=Alteromonas sp. C1M14 TaxID=2841567 RepID=UPI001C09493A|nr:hypothetical protein [Alteromonas sp. C1M14]MBU2979252.1 hypothetical protein [Alteromonas sp. C1M14]
MKLVDNTSQHEHTVISLEADNSANDKLAVNDFTCPQSQGLPESKALFEHEHKPHLFVEHTPLETEQLWKKRLGILLAAEKNFAKVMRLRKSTSIVLVLSVGMSLFSLYVEPTLSPVLFFGLLALAAVSLVVYPASIVATRSSQKHRNDISRMFYQSNHEVDIAGGRMTLINRANNANVTQINIWNDEFG